MKYVAGFMFCGSYVALVKKYNPPWQRGKLNGIGGKVEDNEIPLMAMVREFKEETGYTTFTRDWKQVCALTCYNQDNEESTIFFMKTVSDKCWKLQSLNPPEEISWHITEKVLALDNSLILPNLRWLIPMALYANELTPPILTEK